jgi:ElaB/YqjD/DUF883 family membrane-anchored ribosome-binding protein
MRVRAEWVASKATCLARVSVVASRGAVVAGRHAVEDCAAEATIQVRRHPVVSLGIAAGVGALAGCVIGFAIGRLGGRR